MQPSTGGWSRPATAAWSFAYVMGGYLATALGTALLLPLAGQPYDPARGALLQAAVGIIVFGGLSVLIGRRILRMGRAELGWERARVGVKGFGRGLLLGLGIGAAALAIGVVFGVAGWSLDGGTFPAYLARGAGLAGVLLPAALMEELAFRGAAIAGFRRAVGPGTAILVSGLLFGLAHRLNPGLTPMALGNITLAGIWLGLTFFARGGLWTATGAHLGWNLALAGLAAPVSGIPFTIPWIDFDPGEPAWLTGGSFGPEGGLFATVALAIGVGVAARWWTRKEDG